MVERFVGLAASFRNPTQLPVDVDSIAEELGVSVHSKRLSSNFWGLTISAEKVVLNSELSARRRRFTLAHEIGHVLVRKNLCPWVNIRSEELFADKFARELLIPAQSDFKDSRLEDLLNRFDVEERALFSQIAAVGLIPAVTMSDEGVVICNLCGDIDRSMACDCTINRWANVPAPLARSFFPLEPRCN